MHVNNKSFWYVENLGEDVEGQESEAESAGDFFPVPYPSAFEIISAVRFKSGKNFISCFILHKDSTAVRARAASTWPVEFHTGYGDSYGSTNRFAVAGGVT